MRSRALLTTVAVVAILALAPAAPADTKDVASDQLCGTIPTDRGFTLTPDEGAPRPSCGAQAGDCGADVEERRTCISLIVVQMPTVDEARAALYPTQAWEATSGWGDQATRYECDFLFGCGLAFARDRFLVNIYNTYEQGFLSAQDIATHIDARLQELIGEEGTAPGPGQVSTTTTTTEPPEAGAAAAGVFFGTDRVPALFPGIGQVLDCAPAVLEAEGIIGCVGDARQTLAGLDAAFAGAYPDPSNRRLEGAGTYATAVVLANLTGTDGEPLFPAMQGALPLLEKLDDPRIAERFLEMVAGNDASQWEKRGL